jgi:hypothetical protein
MRLTPRRLEVITTWVRWLSNDDAEQIVSALTKPGSEFQDEVRKGESDTHVALVRSGGRVYSWAATHQWDGMQTLEGFTAEEFRRGGMARLAAAALIADRSIVAALPTAVFAPYCVPVAKSVGCRDVRLFQRDDIGGWVEVTTNE